MWTERIEALGFGLGDAVGNLGRLLHIKDMFGGPLMSSDSDLAVVVNNSGLPIKVQVLSRSEDRWSSVYAKTAADPADLQTCLVDAAGRYYELYARKLEPAGPPSLKLIA